MSLAVLTTLICFILLIFGFLVACFLIIPKNHSDRYTFWGSLILISFVILSIVVPTFIIKYLKDSEYEIVEVYEECQPIVIWEDKEGEKGFLTTVTVNNWNYADNILIFRDGKVELLSRNDYLISDGEEITVKYAKVKWGKVTHKTWIFIIPDKN